mmetsp:Transcript_20078/g.41445  ORF Transcript_20078/g.41445 Transcript_20078/m.41445 type:complete len:264 (+) Transcript_20078:3-794(+)
MRGRTPSESSCSSRSSSRSSSSSSSSSASAVSVDEGLMVGHRRSTRQHRTLEEKASHWRIVRTPAFEAWARDTFVTQADQPKPHFASSEISGLELLPAPVPLPRSTSWQEPPHRESTTALRGRDGKLQTFVTWQDEQGRTGRRRKAISADFSPEEERFLQDAVKQRANQLCLPVYTASFLRRQKVRCSTAPERREVAAEANRFNNLYALTQAAMEGRLSFAPPVRSNSVSLGQVVRFMENSDAPCFKEEIDTERRMSSLSSMA